eukprot:gene13225-9071_t
MPRRPLLGNWFEDEAYERDRKLLMGNIGGLNTSDASSEVATILAKVKHHTAPYDTMPMAEDGWLRFYTPVILQSMHNGHVLSLDLEDRTCVSTGWEVACSASPQTAPQLRNAVILVPSPMPPSDTYPVPGDEKDIVHYGQPFYIMTVPELCDNPLFLISQMKTPSLASKVSGKYQHVCYSPDGGGSNAMWAIDYWESDYQEDMRDRPVKASDYYFVRHHMTAGPLVCGEDTYLTDFGKENEVGALLVTQYASKRRAGPVTDSNLWMFMHRGQAQHPIMQEKTLLRFPNRELKSMGQPPQITDSEKAKRKFLKDYYTNLMSRMTPLYREASANGEDVLPWMSRRSPEIEGERNPLIISLYLYRSRMSRQALRHHTAVFLFFLYIRAENRGSFHFQTTTTNTHTDSLPTTQHNQNRSGAPPWLGLVKVKFVASLFIYNAQDWWGRELTESVNNKKNMSTPRPCLKAASRSTQRFPLLFATYSPNFQQAAFVCLKKLILLFVFVFFTHTMSAPAPPGTNMPKKIDPRLRGVKAPPSKEFFDSADYEVRKQREG